MFGVTMCESDCVFMSECVKVYECVMKRVCKRVCDCV